jgi:hypothetical protein
MRKLASIQKIKETHRSAYEAIHGQEPDFTFPTPLIPPQELEMVDYLFYDPNVFKVKTCVLIGAQSATNDAALYASDHYGLAAQVEWVAGSPTY